MLIPKLSFIPPPKGWPQNASIYLTPALSTLSKASVKVNILKVHICTPIFQLAVTSFVPEVFVTVESESVAVFEVEVLHCISIAIPMQLTMAEKIFFIEIHFMVETVAR